MTRRRSAARLGSAEFYVWRMRLQASRKPHGRGPGCHESQARHTGNALRLLPVQVVDSANALFVGSARLTGGSGAVQIEIALPDFSGASYENGYLPATCKRAKS